MENRINHNFTGSYMKAIFGYKPFSRHPDKVNDNAWLIPAAK